VENRIRHKYGSYHWLLTLGKCMRDASGKTLRLIGTVLNINERKRAEVALRASETLLAEAQELAHVGSWNWDMATGLLTWSDEHYRIFGLERQESSMTFERGNQRHSPG